MKNLGLLILIVFVCFFAVGIIWQLFKTVLGVAVVIGLGVLVVRYLVPSIFGK